MKYLRNQFRSTKIKLNNQTFLIQYYPKKVNKFSFIEIEKMVKEVIRTNNLFINNNVNISGKKYFSTVDVRTLFKNVMQSYNNKRYTTKGKSRFYLEIEILEKNLIIKNKFSISSNKEISRRNLFNI